ncbi:hypothetical protein [Streptococcus ictaluri]|uniref:hypothetical protein n=1 Tax=Streptococcus ictaluri TaxID=380397 RepID=UPI001389A3AC|nr:hypothetical protein [Streptococcus ictaluri]
MIGLLIFLVSQKSFLSNAPKDFSLSSKADLYIVKRHSISGFKLTKQRAEQIVETKLPVIKGQVNTAVPARTIANRYLLFSEEGPPLGIEGKVISIDFLEGKLRQFKTKDYAYSSSGASKSYYFSSKASSEGTFLAVFDKDLKQKDHFIFKDSLFINNFSISGQSLYFTSVKAVKGGYQPFLVNVTISPEGKLTLKSQEPLLNDPDYNYSFGGSLLKQNDFYAVVNGVRHKTSKEKFPAKELFHYHLSSKKKELIPLSDIAPFTIFDLDKDYLAIEHESNDLGKLGFSLFNTKDKSSFFVDLGQLGIPFKNHRIKDIRRYDDKSILILVGNTLLHYDILNRELQSSTQLSHKENEALYIWVPAKSSKIS